MFDKIFDKRVESLTYDERTIIDMANRYIRESKHLVHVVRSLFDVHTVAPGSLKRPHHTVTLENKVQGSTGDIHCGVYVTRYYSYIVVDGKGNRRNVQTEKFEILCNGCECYYKNEYNFRTHNCNRRKCRKDNAVSVTCKFCGKLFTFRQAYLQHAERCTEQTPDIKKKGSGRKRCQGYDCACGKNFKAIEDVAEHQVICKPAGKHTCSCCERTFTTQDIMRCHKATCVFLINCSICGALCNGSRRLRKHMKGHQDAGVFPCEYCGVVFATKTQVVTHTAKEHVPIYRCETCEERFGTKGLLDRHVYDKHSSSLSLFCNICKLSFPSKKEFEQHASSHM